MKLAERHLGEPSHGWFAGVVVAGLSWILQIIALTVPTTTRGPAGFDERAFHLVTIRQFASELPRPDLSDYNVASAPGYHLAIAAIDRLFSPPLDLLRFISGQSAIALVVLVAWWTARRAGTGWGIVAGITVLLSEGIASQTVLLLPEGFSWLVVWFLLLASLSGKVHARLLFGAGLLTTVLVFSRQIHLWAASILWLSAWLGPRQTGYESSSRRAVPRLSELRLRERLPRTALAVLATLPAFAVVAWLFSMWGGPVPPGFREGQVVEAGSVHNGGNPATPALAFALFGMLGPMIMLPLVNVWRVRADLRPLATKLALFGAAAGAVSSLCVATTLNREAGRWTGLWDQTTRFLEVYDRSLLILALATLGGGLLGAALALMRSRDRLVFAGIIVAFTVAHSANHQAWVRYVEPMVVLSLLTMTTLALQRSGMRPARWTLIGPLAAIAMQAYRSLPDLLGFTLS